MAEGPNLVSNGDFPVNIGDWNHTGLGGATFTWDSNDGGRALISVFVNPPGGPFASSSRAWQAITVVANTDYKATWNIKIAGTDQSGDPAFTASASIGLSEGSSEHGLILSNSTGIKTLEFTTGAETTIYMNFLVTVASFNFPANNSVNFDDVTLKEQLSGLFVPRIMVL